MIETIVFWHRRDLRLTDNLGLRDARERSPRVVGVFCLDPEILQGDDMAPARRAYLLGCLPELARHYREAGGRLVLLEGNPLEQLPRLARALQASSVFWNEDGEPYARRIDRKMEQILSADDIRTNRHWDQLLHRPLELATGEGRPYQVFGPFWRKWHSLPKPAPMASLERFQPLTDAQWKAAGKAIENLREPTTEKTLSLRNLGAAWSAPLPIRPGETAAGAMLDRFLGQAIVDYASQRNFPALPGTSLLSAAFCFGTLGIRTAWAAVDRAEALCPTSEGANGFHTWRQELAWREFYQHALWHFPQLAEGPFRPEWQDFRWENRDDLFQAWMEGRTGFPMVDAAMRQLRSTGWMHNRCRMIVASFLTKDLCIDWRWGERFFMQNLVDGDLAANNGGWQWSASSGMDPKPLRIFNPFLQAQKFDPQADYIRTWLPELRKVVTASLLSGKIPSNQRCGYPPPVVAHQQRQAHFRILYARHKAQSGSLKADPRSPIGA